MRRRLVSVTSIIFGLVLWLIASPIWIVGSILVDGFSRLWRFPTLRLFGFGGVYLVHEWCGLVAAASLWVTGRFGTRLNLDQHRRVQSWWSHSLLVWAGRLLNVRFEFDDLSVLPDKSFIVLSRHASMFDAVLPVEVVTNQMGRFVHYVLKRELRWDPNLDFFGSRLRNYFVARGHNTDQELDGIEELARSAEPDSALVIFPEGTYATPSSRERVLTSLKRRADAATVARAQALTSLLPPKPAGTLAMLRGQPNADVVVFGHVGLEGVAEFRGLRRRLPLTTPVRVRWWVHQRHELPNDEAAIASWLQERWQTLDTWVNETR